MTSPLGESSAERVLVLAPTGRDAALARDAITRAGMAAEICVGIGALLAAVDAGAGALLLAEESLRAGAASALVAALERQPPWSDLPIVLMTAGGNYARGRVPPLSGSANVTLIERPMAVRTLISAMQSALRARRRQYQVRDLLAELERTLDERAQLYRDASSANRLKDEFLMTLSHELRTPLTAILGWTHILQTGEVSPERRQRALDTIARNARAQAVLVEDLLDVSRMVAGKLRLEFRPVELQPIVMLAIESARPSAERKQVALDAQLDARNGVVVGDPDRLQQVVWNLLSNAIKFTPGGGSVRVRVAPGAGNIEITVTDSGRGISAEFLPFVFERFRQAESSATRTQGGLGIGLAITRHLVELHGGSIEVRSEGTDRGTTFRVTLPVASQ